MAVYSDVGYDGAELNSVCCKYSQSLGIFFFYPIWIRVSIINAFFFVTCEMRLLNQMLNLSRIFDCFSRRFDKVVFNLKLSNLVDLDVPSQSSYLSNLKKAGQ